MQALLFSLPSLVDMFALFPYFYNKAQGLEGLWGREKEAVMLFLYIPREPS